MTEVKPIMIRRYTIHKILSRTKLIFFQSSHQFLDLLSKAFFSQLPLRESLIRQTLILIFMLLFSQTGFSSTRIQTNNDLVATWTQDAAQLTLVFFTLLFLLLFVIFLFQLRKLNTKMLQLKQTNSRLEQEIHLLDVEYQTALHHYENLDHQYRETQAFLLSLIEAMPYTLITVNYHGFVTHWNTKAEMLTGICQQQALGHHLHDVFQLCRVSLEGIRDSIHSGEPRYQEKVPLIGQGETQFLNISILPLKYMKNKSAVICIDNITDKVRVENMLIQNEKMMSLGELAAGMAHEINNPLSAILQGVQNILRRTMPEKEKNAQVAATCQTQIDSVHTYLKERGILRFLTGIKVAGERAAAIVTNMLEFAHSHNSHHQATDIAQLIQDTLGFAANMFELKSQFDFKHIHLKTQIDVNLPYVHCARAELQQVLLNLLRNSAQALAHREQPEISVRVYEQHKDLVIEVADNGPGMTDYIKRHIFDPFFTTKAAGKGTGLGLSVSYFIVTERHGGQISVESKPNAGAKFIIRLPSINSPQQDQIQQQDRIEPELEEIQSEKIQQWS